MSVRLSPADYEALRQQLIRHEGLRLKPYKDVGGRVTIGVGRNLTDCGISRAEALLLLETDLQRALRDCQSWPWFNDLDPVRQRVLIDMAFNLGLPSLRTFRGVLTAVADGRYGDAAEAMLKSLWARQVGARAITLAGMMRTGIA